MIITERFKVLFDISDIGQSRGLSKSQLFSFLHVLGVFLLLGVIHYCPWTSISLFMAISTVIRGGRVVR